MSNIQEEWRTIHNKFEVSNRGRFRSKDRLLANGQIKKGVVYSESVNGKGYPNVDIICSDGIMRVKTIHRLVAEAFISNPNNLPIINHINGIRTDNRTENLEWCDYSHNTKHSYDVLKRVPPNKGKIGAMSSNHRGVIQLSMDGLFLMAHDCIRDAYRLTGINQSCIGLCARGKTQQAGYFKWIYTNERKTTPTWRLSVAEAK